MEISDISANIVVEIKQNEISRNHTFKFYNKFLKTTNKPHLVWAVFQGLYIVVHITYIKVL